MGARLVIAEKPSVGRAIARAVGADNRIGQTLRGAGYIVTWAHGHIVDLASPDDYEGAGWDGAWDLSVLPMVPDVFEMRVSTEKGAAELFGLIERLVKSPEVDEVVHAGDPDREGEGIVRRVLALAGNAKPVLRLWCSSTEAPALRAALADMRPDSDYDGLADAAQARAEADWLVGMNATRALTCLYGRTVYAGRVTTALLRLVSDRTRENASFERVPHWVPTATVPGGAVFEAERFPSPEAAAKALERMAGLGLTVTGIETSRSNRPAPRPYSLTAMQRDASRLLGMSAARSLAAAQALYEAGLQTYPRTDSRAITSSEMPALAAFLASGDLDAIIGADRAEAARSLGMDAARAVDDAAVAGHPALMPTRMLTAQVHASLPEDERLVSSLVCANLAAACTGARSMRVTTRVEAEAGGVRLSHSSTEITESGWEAVMPTRRGPDPRTAADLPSLRVGSALTVESLGVREGASTPPRLFTDDTLLAAMEHADRLVEDPDLKEALGATGTHSGGIGTPATRTPAIERLVKIGYIERTGGSIRSTELGLWADSLSPVCMATPEMTARWERSLDDVETGLLPRAELTASMAMLASQIVGECRDGFDASLVRPAPQKGLGACPRCGEPMVRSKDGAYIRCTSRRYGQPGADGKRPLVDEGCGYLFASNVRGHAMTDTEVRELLAKGSVRLNGLAPKGGGRPYSARVVTDANGEWPTRVVVDAVARRPRGRGRRS